MKLHFFFFFQGEVLVELSIKGTDICFQRRKAMSHLITTASLGIQCSTF